MACLSPVTVDESHHDSDSFGNGNLLRCPKVSRYGQNFHTLDVVQDHAIDRRFHIGWIFMWQKGTDQLAIFDTPGDPQ